MDKRLLQIKKIFEIEFDGNVEFNEWDEDDWQFIDVDHMANFCIDQDRIKLSFYSGMSPDITACFIKILHAHKVVDFDIVKNMYWDFKGDKCVGALFGKEADERCRETIFYNMLDKKKLEQWETKGNKH